MVVQTHRDRTREILERFAQSKASATSAPDATRRHEILLTEAIRQLRDNKADCVHGERRDAERIGGERWAANAEIDLGYAQVKAEIDAAISDLVEEKAALRRAKAEAPAIDLSVPPAADPHNEQLIKLADLHSSGILSAQEFAAAKERLSSDRS